MVRIDGRPLLGTFDDRQLFVEPGPMARIRAAVSRGLNVCVLGSPGSGKTSVLRVLVADLTKGGERAVYVDLAPARTAEQALVLIADALGQHDALTSWADALRAGLVPPAVASEHLLRLVRRLAETAPTVICADSPPGEGATHTLFGRLRDELWQLEHQWVVAIGTSLRDEVARPPASAFFDVTVELGPLPRQDQEELLRRRVAGDPLLDGLPESLAGRSDGLPRSVLELAREAALNGGDAGAALRSRDALRSRLATLSAGAQSVAAYLQTHGPASASDAELLQAVGVSAQRARQLLGELEAAGVARSYREQASRRGRPKKLYELMGGVAATPGSP